jgi:hypothetical protein
MRFWIGLGLRKRNYYEILSEFEKLEMMREGTKKRAKIGIKERGK